MGRAGVDDHVAMRRGLWIGSVGMLAAAIAGLASAQVISSGGEQQLTRSPKPLRGVPLHAATGLRLLVASSPPYLLDVDHGQITPVSGLPAVPHAALSVQAAGEDAVVWLDRLTAGRSVPLADIYVIRHGTTSAEPLGSAWSVAATRDGRGLWLVSFSDPDRRTLRQVGLDGSDLAAPRSISCSTRLTDGGFGIVSGTGDDSLVDLASGRTLVQAESVFAVAGEQVLGARAGVRLTLTNLRDGARAAVRWPSIVGGLDTPAVHPRGRLVAVGFGDPAWYGGGRQVSDVWLLDTATHRIRQLPEMPAFVSLKFTSMAWTRDGRLVLLAESAGRTLVGVWRPGEKRIATKTVRLPARNSGSDTFVLW